ncbi:MAG: hypothetical protein LBS43_09210 [Prevotellaceae bacterium]|nr:hypothetical protein [Prevotellaceae bacterium]
MFDVVKISLMITAIYVCCQDGMIFSEIRIFAQNQLDRLFGRWSDIVQKPLFGCMTCMSSVWGLTGCVALGVPAAEWVFTILQVCGLNVVISSVINRNS